MRPGAPGGDKTDSLFHRKDMYWVADIEEVVESTMDKTNTFMRERGLIPLNEREMVRTWFIGTRSITPPDLRLGSRRWRQQPMQILIRVEWWRDAGPKMKGMTQKS
jgi:hypothetical protein